MLGLMMVAQRKKALEELREIRRSLGTMNEG